MFEQTKAASPHRDHRRYGNHRCAQFIRNIILSSSILACQDRTRPGANLETVQRNLPLGFSLESLGQALVSVSSTQGTLGQVRVRLDCQVVDSLAGRSLRGDLIVEALDSS